MTHSRSYSRYGESQERNWLFWSLCMHFYFGLLCLLYLDLTIASVIPRPNSPLAGSPACFQSPVSDFQCFFFFFFWLIHRSARSHRLFLKGQWKVTEQSKSHVSRPTLIVRRGLHCYSKTTRLEVSKGEQDLRLNLLNICFSHLW